MKTIAQLVAIAFLVESIWETLKMVWQENKLQTDKLGALIIGLVVTFTLQLDLFVILEFNECVGVMGIIATGILVSRGGNFIHDLMGILEGGIK